MNNNNHNSQAQTRTTDVAMFIDWENMHGVLGQKYHGVKPNISALREVADGLGRLVVAKAYADWRENRFQRDSFYLYKAGFDPVYVPNGYKNNADVKLATDCVDYAYRHPNIDIFILVTGDGDFIHVVTTLRPLGKKVVVVAQSKNASSRLGDLVDTLLIYDKDVNPARPTRKRRTPKAKDTTERKKLDSVYQDIVQFIKNEEGTPLLLTNVKQQLIRKYGKFSEAEYGFDKFKDFIQSGATEGFYELSTAGLRNWLTLKTDEKTHLPDEIETVYPDLIAIIQHAPGKGILLSTLKNKLIEKYGSFDESVYGFSKFKDLVIEGNQAGHFKLGVNESGSDYAYV